MNRRSDERLLDEPTVQAMDPKGIREVAACDTDRKSRVLVKR